MVVSDNFQLRVHTCSEVCSLLAKMKCWQISEETQQSNYSLPPAQGQKQHLNDYTGLALGCWAFDASVS